MFVTFVSTFCASLSAHPIDMIWTRHQLTDGSLIKLSMKKTFVNIVKKEGVLALWKGVIAKIYSMSALTLIWLPIYD